MQQTGLSSSVQVGDTLLKHTVQGCVWGCRKLLVCLLTRTWLAAAVTILAPWNGERET